MFRSTGKAVKPFVLPGLRTALETVKSVVPLPFVAPAVDVALNVVTAIEVSFSGSFEVVMPERPSP